MSEYLKKTAEKILLTYNTPENVTLEYLKFQDDSPLISNSKTNAIRYTDIIVSSILDENDEFASVIFYKEKNKEKYEYTYNQDKINEIINSHTSEYFKYKFRKNPKYLKAMINNKEPIFQKLALDYTDNLFDNIKKLEDYFNLKSDIDKIDDNVSFEEIYFVFIKNDINGFLEKNIDKIKSYYQKKELNKIKELLNKLSEKNNLFDILKNESYEKIIDIMQVKEYKRNFNLITKEFNKERLSIDILDKLNDFSKFGIKHSEFKDKYSKKISLYKTKEDILNSLDLFFYNFKKWNIKEIENKINELGLKLVNYKNYKIVEIENYKQSQEIGSNLWCISTNERNFNSYKSNGNRQYFVYDFTKEKDEALSFLGITVDPMGKIESAHDRYDECILENEILEDFKFKKLDKKYFLNKGKSVSETIVDMVDANAFEILDDYLVDCYKKNEDINYYAILKSIHKKKYDNKSFVYPKKILEGFSKEKTNNFNINEKEMYLYFLNICKKNGFNIDVLFENAINTQNKKLDFLMSNETQMETLRKENKDLIFKKTKEAISNPKNNQDINYNSVDSFMSFFLKNEDLINLINYKENNILEIIMRKMDNKNEFFINNFLKKLNKENTIALELKSIGNENFNGFQYLDKSIIEKFDLKRLTLSDYFKVFNNIGNISRNEEYLTKVLKDNSPKEKLNITNMAQIALIQNSETRAILIKENILKEKDYIVLIGNKLIDLGIEDIKFSKNVFKYCAKMGKEEIENNQYVINKYISDLLDKNCDMSNLKSYMKENYKYVNDDLKKIIIEKKNQKKIKW